MTKLPAKRYCAGCGIEIVFGILAPTPRGQEPRWAAFEATDQPAFSDHAVGARVFVADRQAWRPVDLVEDVMVRRELDEEAARELVSGFPFRRIHSHNEQTPNGASA